MHCNLPDYNCNFQVLNVSRMLAAAITARSAESVEAGVSALVRWIEANAAFKRTCFLDGACGPELVSHGWFSRQRSQLCREALLHGAWLVSASEVQPCRGSCVCI